MNNDIQNAFKYKEQLQKEWNQFYKEYFGKSKDTNFMLKVKEKIMKLPQTNIILSQVFSGDNLLHHMMFGFQNHDFEIAKNIYMIHKENTELLSDMEKEELRNDSKYIDLIIKSTLVQLNIRKYGTVSQRREFYQSFKPSIYSTVSLLTYTLNLFNVYTKKINMKNNDFFITMISKILNKCYACISLIEINLHEEAYAMLRVVAELYLIFNVLIDKNEDIVSTYSKHVEWSFEYNRTGDFPPELNGKTNKMDYLNFGWLDSIFEYGYINRKKYKLSDVADLIDLKKVNGKKITFGSDIYKIYKLCNPLSHASNNIINNKEEERILIKNLGALLLNITKEMRALTHDSFIFNNIDLIAYNELCLSLNLKNIKKYNDNIKSIKN